MKTNMLKMLALKAKNRMMNKNTGDAYFNSKIKIINVRDDDFVDKVRGVLENEKKSINPLKYLMDEKVLFKLDGRAREKYLLEITEKYLKAKSQIEKEKLAS